MKKDCHTRFNGRAISIFLFASDFPHEIADNILHEIEEVNEAPISVDGKRLSCGKTPSAFTKFN
jgi:hypothetical protein